MDLQGQRILVVGLAKSGLACVRLLSERGVRVIGNDIRDEVALGEAAKQARQAGAELVLGGHEPELFSSVDRIVLSPGVPPMPALEAAERAGVPIASEIELASWFLQGTVLGITGTNGKSTVTAMLGAMCQKTGRPTFVGGNLGTPLVEVVGTRAAERDGLVVVELSSFQLERVARLHVHVAALLNVSDDHLDRYASFEQYAQTKARIFHGQSADDAAIVAAQDTRCEQLASTGRARLFRFGGNQGAVRIVGGRLVDSETELSLPVVDLPVQGGHNLQNACAAALMARLAGVCSAHISEVLGTFQGLPHRMEHVCDLGQVAYYDDSKATNVGAAAAALDGLRDSLQDRGGRVVLIAGGKHKGGDYGPIRQRLARVGRALIVMGEAAALIDRAMSGSGLLVESVTSMQMAVDRARELARPGDVVLLAPACASFDMFRSYAHRGEVFQRVVRTHKAGGI